MSERARYKDLATTLLVGATVGVTSGVASAAFLTLLDAATQLRQRQAWLVFLLPVAGLVLGRVLELLGNPTAAGNALVADTLRKQAPKLPLRLAPTVLVGTVLTHLFGGSAGREGTAVQMGASLADALAHACNSRPALRRYFLVAGVSGGFGSVFGTPVAAALFAIEFAAAGALDVTCLLTALTASTVGDAITRGLGIVHATYPQVPHLPLTIALFGKWLAFAAAIALISRSFVTLVHLVRDTASRLFPRLPVRMACGGVLVVLLWQASRTSAYLGLGTAAVERAFVDPTLPPFAFAAKAFFTATTLGFGFLGGETTPLFFIGASLGNVLAQALHVPLALGAGLGMAAVFATAANTPLALSVIGVELFGKEILPHVMLVCALAHPFAGRRRLYGTKGSDPFRQCTFDNKN